MEDNNQTDKMNPFFPNPLQDMWALSNWYVNSDIEDRLFKYLHEQTPVSTPKNFIIMGQGGSGKTTLGNYIQKKIWRENESIHDGAKTYAILISITSAHDLRKTLIDIIMEYLTVKSNLTPAEYSLYNAIKKPNTARNMPLSFLEDFFTTSFDTRMSKDPRNAKQTGQVDNNKNELIIILDNAHFLLKDRFFKGFITGKGFESRFSIGLLVTPKSYTDLRNNDPDRVLDRFTLIMTVGKWSFEQTKEALAKRLDCVSESLDNFLTEDQLWVIYTSLNGVPRPIMLVCRDLFEIYSKNGTIEEKDVAQALANVKLETLDYQGIDDETKSILNIFMQKKGIVETNELLVLGIPRASLYIKLNNMVQERMIAPCLNQETGEKVRGKWQLDPLMSSIIYSGPQNQYVKPYEEQE